MNDTASVHLSGPIGEALDASLRGRLSHFIVDEHSPAIAIFGAAHKRTNVEGDWYGEHAGKWLIAASKAAARTGDATLREHVRRVADFLVTQQEPDGYLGTYAPERRFMVPQPPRPVTWDGAPALRTWDIWTHAYLVLGLIEAHRLFDDPRLLDAARRIGDLCWRTLHDDGIDITGLGNHFGMSATVLMDPAVELFFATGEQRYLDLASLILAQAEANPHLAIVARALSGADASEIATGKAYQLLWNLVGIAKLHRAAGVPAYRDAVERLWHNVRDHHLTLGGGPWGGVAHRSREVFNPGNYFSPHGYVETCSVLAWLQLNRELLTITGDPRHADEIERTAFNDLLGAMAPDGEDWCYYTFPNGQRVHTTYWRCCKSSGAMALEELPGLVARSSAAKTLALDHLGPGRVTCEVPDIGRVMLEPQGDYPFDADVRLHVTIDRPTRFALAVRVPAWASEVGIGLEGGRLVDATPGTYATLDREWHSGDVVALRLPMPPVVHRRVQQNVQESRAPDGSPVRQSVLHYEYVAVTRGPIAYATPLIDGFRTAETIRLPAGPWIAVLPSSAEPGPTLRLSPEGRAPIDFVPFYRAGGRDDGAWRLTWLSVAPRVPKSAG